MRYHSRQKFEKYVIRPKNENKLRVMCEGCKNILNIYNCKKIFGGDSIDNCESLELQCNLCNSITRLNIKD